MDKETRYIIKGNICYSKSAVELNIVENGYLVCENGLCAGVYAPEELPAHFRGLPCHDYVDGLIIPGLIDLHLHAPQYSFRGLGMDMELMEWLSVHTFPEEAKYADLDYADKAYNIFVEDLVKSATTRACIFGTLHTPATLLLMKKLEGTGMKTYVGKVNMDRNCPANLCEESPEQAARDTEEWIEASFGLEHVKPILTPRFTPSCSDELMRALSKLQKKYQLPVQSHLSESQGEIQLVKELCPDISFYGEAYNRFGLFGGKCSTIMAHCVYSGPEETTLMKERGVFIAHCPESNTNLISGIAPVRYYLDRGMKVGLGSDMAAGTSLSLFKAMAMAIQCSKLRYRLMDDSHKPLGLEEVFFLATKGGGEFFGKVGSFEAGYELDAVVLDDSAIKHPRELSVKERLERLIYLAEERHVTAKYVAGRKIY